jgi:hypothetical protein
MRSAGGPTIIGDGANKANCKSEFPAGITGGAVQVDGKAGDGQEVVRQRLIINSV